MAQLRMELVDIWHSFSVRNPEQTRKYSAGQNGSDSSTYTKNQFASITSPMVWLKSAGKAQLAGRPSCKATRASVRYLNLFCRTADELARAIQRYVGKNVLNVFRQDHGYKAGTYIKIWNGREDNEHLVEVLGMVDLNSGDVRDSLYQSLKARYALVLE